MVQEKEKGKINEALAILEEAAKDKKEELEKLVGSGYTNVRELFAEGLKKSGQAQEKLGDAVSDGEKIVEETFKKGSMYAQDAADRLDKEIHNKPMLYLTIFSAASLFIGYLLGSKKEGDK